MEIKQADVHGLKKGSYIMIEGQPCQITEINRSAPGKHGHAKFRITGVGIISKNKRIIVIAGGKRVESPIIEKKNGQVLSITENNAQIMNSESFEVFEIEIPDEFKTRVSEGSQIVFMDLGEFGKKIVVVKKT
ncbi:MAG: translation initiation factor IF-5A [Nanoarchaeota archaeon]|nr:translation initiation factor IF-5A [Nanoarchaeota archaeon]